MSHTIKIDGRPKQIQKLRNGHSVRIKGNGVYSLIVNPQHYNLLSKSFEKDKAAQIKLTSEEILLNKENQSEMMGNGIFGRKFDKKVREVVGKPTQKAIYKTASEYGNPIAKAGIISAASALALAQPELAAFLPAVVALSSDYIDNPRKYQGKEKIKKQSKDYIKRKVEEKINKTLPINQPVNQTSNPYSIYGLGLYLGSSKGGSINSSYTIKEGINTMSQPEFENFQYRSTMQPIFTNIKGNGLYM